MSTELKKQNYSYDAISANRFSVSNAVYGLVYESKAQKERKMLETDITSHNIKIIETQNKMQNDEEKLIREWHKYYQRTKKQRPCIRKREMIELLNENDYLKQECQDRIDAKDLQLTRVKTSLKKKKEKYNRIYNKRCTLESLQSASKAKPSVRPTRNQDLSKFISKKSIQKHHEKVTGDLTNLSVESDNLNQSLASYQIKIDMLKSKISELREIDQVLHNENSSRNIPHNASQDSCTSSKVNKSKDIFQDDNSVISVYTDQSPLNKSITMKYHMDSQKPFDTSTKVSLDKSLTSEERSTIMNKFHNISKVSRCSRDSLGGGRYASEEEAVDDLDNVGWSKIEEDKDNPNDSDESFTRILEVDEEYIGSNCNTGRDGMPSNASTPSPIKEKQHPNLIRHVPHNSMNFPLNLFSATLGEELQSKQKEVEKVKKMDADTGNAFRHKASKSDQTSATFHVPRLDLSSINN